MGTFAVDQERCLHDGICVDVCPRFLIEMPEDGSGPVRIAEGESLCIDCGHCVAACPTGALTVGDMSLATCPEVRSALLPSAEQLEHLLRARRSIRAFEARTVPQETLARLIGIAHYAPTGSNRQQVEWLVVQDPADVQRLARMVEEWMRQGETSQAYADSLARAAERGLDLVCRGAPHVILAHTPKGGETNGVIALTFLELAAFSLGLGACWGGFFNSAANNWPPLRETLGLPEGRAFCGAMLLGYSRYRYQRLPLRREAHIAWRAPEESAVPRAPAG